MEAVLQHYVVISVLVWVVWSGSTEGHGYQYYSRPLYCILTRRRSRQLYPPTTSRIQRDFKVNSARDSSSPPQLFHFFLPSVTQDRAIVNRGYYTTQNRNIPLQNRYNTLTGRFLPQRQNGYFQNGYQVLPSLSNGYSSNSQNSPGKPRVLERRTNVYLRDEPHLEVNPNTPKQELASFLDPTNFKLQDMDLSQMQTALDLIDMHISVKENDPSIYTGSRVLVLLLREQCFRLRSSGDPDIDIFCQQFDNRFRPLYCILTRRRSRQLYPPTTSRIQRDFKVNSARDSSSPPQLFHFFLPSVTQDRAIVNRGYYTTQNRNIPLQNRYNTLTGRFLPQRQNGYFQNGYQVLPSLSNGYSSNSQNSPGKPRVLERRTNVYLRDEPHLEVNPNTPKQELASFLDPTNFKLQDMDLSQMQTALDLIDMHISVKENDPSIYTGSRVLVLLLREQCFRLRSSGDPDIDIFCQQFDNRFRSFLF